MNRQRGFTLVEIAVVLVIVGAILGIVLTGVVGFAKNAANASTRTKEAAIRDALVYYLKTNKALPCPAMSTNGVEPRTSGDTTTVCGSKVGFVPYATLGLPKDAALDAWGNFIQYVVTSDWTVSTNFSPSSVGEITVHTAVSGSSADSPYLAALVLISGGAGGEGATNVDGTKSTLKGSEEEQSNASGCASLQCYALALSDTFDDVVLPITSAEMFQALHVAGWQPEADCAGLKAQLTGLVIQTADYPSSLVAPNGQSVPVDVGNDLVVIGNSTCSITKAEIRGTAAKVGASIP